MAARAGLARMLSSLWSLSARQSTTGYRLIQVVMVLCYHWDTYTPKVYAPAGPAASLTPPGIGTGEAGLPSQWGVGGGNAAALQTV